MGKKKSNKNGYAKMRASTMARISIVSGVLFFGNFASEIFASEIFASEIFASLPPIPFPFPPFLLSSSTLLLLQLPLCSDLACSPSSYLSVATWPPETPRITFARVFFQLEFAQIIWSKSINLQEHRATRLGFFLASPRSFLAFVIPCLFDKCMSVIFIPK